MQTERWHDEITFKTFKSLVTAMLIMRMCVVFLLFSRRIDGVEMK
jgi:hypothetical protein